MKLHLPNGKKITLDNNLEIEEKIELSSKLLEEWHDIIHKNWTSISVVYFLDGLANYLVWHKEKEDFNTEDKEVISLRKIEEMTGRREPMSQPFSNLNTNEKTVLGLEVKENE